MSGCIPAVLKSTDGSFSGTRGALGTTACHLEAKNARYLERISVDEIYAGVMESVKKDLEKEVSRVVKIKRNSTLYAY
jgi:hypothetical protein